MVIVTFIHMCERVYMFINCGIKCISYYGSWLKRKEIKSMLANLWYEIEEQNQEDLVQGLDLLLWTIIQCF